MRVVGDVVDVGERQLAELAPASTAPTAADRSARLGGVRPAPARRPAPKSRDRAPGRPGRRASSTAATAPAMAKSPWRRANSATPKPVRPGPHRERRSPVSSSSGSSAVDHTPVKKSAAGDGAGARRLRRTWNVGVEGEGHGRVLGRRVGVGQRAADRAPVADLEVADVRRGRAEQRHVAAATSARARASAVAVTAPIRDVAVRRGRCLAARRRGRGRRGARTGEPQGEHRHQALAAGEHLRLVARVASSATASANVVGAWYSNGAGFMSRPSSYAVRQACDRYNRLEDYSHQLDAPDRMFMADRKWAGADFSDAPSGGIYLCRACERLGHCRLGLGREELNPTVWSG